MLATALPILAATGPTDGIAGWAVRVMEAMGAPGVAVLVAAENIFPPIPSEVFLPLAGFTASVGSMSLVAAILWATVGSLVGAWALYGLGVVLGRDRLLHIIERMPMVDVDDMLKAERVFNKHGKSAVLFGRVMPIVRSLISIPAGLERMNFLLFSVLTFIGSLVWNTALIYAGYALGERYSLVENYVGYFQWVIIAVILAFLVWYVVHYIRHRRDTTRDTTRHADRV